MSSTYKRNRISKRRGNTTKFMRYKVLRKSLNQLKAQEVYKFSVKKLIATKGFLNSKKETQSHRRRFMTLSTILILLMMKSLNKKLHLSSSIHLTISKLILQYYYWQIHVLDRNWLVFMWQITQKKRQS